MNSTPRGRDEESYGKVAGKDPDRGLAQDTGPAQPEGVDRVEPSGGDRRKPADEAAPGSRQSGQHVCPACDGSGRIDGAPCPDCRGTGTITAIVGDA